MNKGLSTDLTTGLFITLLIVVFRRGVLQYAPTVRFAMGGFSEYLAVENEPILNGTENVFEETL
jgi:hypothetical protein